jgi:diguanylate cyclase (GGDEF)-like protein
MLHYLNDKRMLGGVAIIVLSTSQEESLALACLQAGAEDFICKSEITHERIKRAIIHSTARFELEKQLWDSFRRVKELAERDALTGLANRHLFDETLKLAITNNRRKGRMVALILFDLDHFKWVNDSYGHDIGDLLLKRVVQRVTSCLRGNEMFARLGGDEFAIMVMNLENIQQSHNIAQRIIRVLHKPFVIGDLELATSPSIGVALHPDNGSSADELFKNADIAMYRAKRNGRNQACFYSAGMQSEVLRRATIEQDMRLALERDEFELFYQPMMGAATSMLMGAEALIRWRHPHKGLIFPDGFIDVAEETGLIVELGHWIIEAACKQLSVWQNQLKLSSEFTLAINLSPKQLRDTRLLPKIEQSLLDNHIDSRRLELELTESALLDDAESAVTVLQTIADRGIRIALDDFGTGYSSVTHLRLFPIHTVKIDRSIIPSADDKGKARALLRGLVSMLQSLELDIVAEGVEYKEQVGMCESLGVGRIQGYFYSKPLPAADFSKLYLAKSA